MLLALYKHSMTSKEACDHLLWVLIFVHRWYRYTGMKPEDDLRWGWKRTFNEEDLGKIQSRYSFAAHVYIGFAH